MFTQTVNKSDPEVMYGNFTNGEGATITLGHAVALTVTVASAASWGNLGVSPASTNTRLFLGVADEDVADNAVGRYIAYGYCASIFYFGEATSVSVTAANHAAGPGVATSLGVGYTGLTVLFGPIILMESLSGLVRSAGGYVRGFVRAM